MRLMPYVKLKQSTEYSDLRFDQYVNIYPQMLAYDIDFTKTVHTREVYSIIEKYPAHDKGTYIFYLKKIKISNPEFDLWRALYSPEDFEYLLNDISDVRQMLGTKVWSTLTIKKDYTLAEERIFNKVLNHDIVATAQTRGGYLVKELNDRNIEQLSDLSLDVMIEILMLNPPECAVCRFVIKQYLEKNKEGKPSMLIRYAYAYPEITHLINEEWARYEEWCWSYTKGTIRKVNLIFRDSIDFSLLTSKTIFYIYESQFIGIDVKNIAMLKSYVTTYVANNQEAYDKFLVDLSEEDNLGELSWGKSFR